MDKSWIKKPRNTLEYHQGLNGFLDFAFEHSSCESRIICPCNKCGFRKWKTRQEVYDHLICKPFPETYTFWCDHGETLLGESVSCPPIIHESLVDEDILPQIVVEDPMQNIGVKMKLERNVKYVRHLGGSHAAKQMQVVLVPLLPSLERSYLQRLCDTFR